jgi:glucose/arabinose dehydrogenase
MLRLIVMSAIVAAFTTSVSAQVPFRLETLTEDLDQPVFVTAPAGDPRLFVVEKTGRIRIMTGGVVGATPFLDISGSVSTGGEQGLLGLAFHPGYAQNGRFFISFTNREGDTRIVAYTVSADPSIADPASAQELLAIDQPYRNHNGGWIAFGPNGLLYVGMGDGGSGGDPQGNGQNPDALLGKILTLDVDAGGPPKIFASGVRNPWRNAFDGDDFYIADVGQGEWEEINIIPAGQSGLNLGWNVAEGPDCYEAASCDLSGFVMPVHSYSHDEGCSITGGYVYRGAAIPAITGLYFFADYCAGVLHSLRKNGDGAADVTSYRDAFGAIGDITSFGLDSAGEMYVMTGNGALMKVVPAN